MEAYQRQQFDFILMLATDRLNERIVQRLGGMQPALDKLRSDPQGEGVWLDTFVEALFQDLLLNTPAGACFILEALAKRSLPTPTGGTIETMLQQMALRAFADLLAMRAIETLEQHLMYEG